MGGGVRVFHVSHFAPAAVGHGGLHRTLQVEHDIQQLVGSPSCVSVNLERWREARQRARVASPEPAGSRASRQMRRIGAHAKRFRARLRTLRDNPFKLFRVARYASAIPFSINSWVEPEFVADYSALVAKYDGPKICVVEHAVFGQIVELNGRLGIPTVSAFHNLEALDVTRFDWRRRSIVYTVMTDFGNELRLLGRCAQRLVISKVETGFLGGLGLESRYYPYLPVGPIRESLSVTRARRARGGLEPGLIVVLGSAAHGVTGESMRWFAEAALAHGLPTGVRVVAVGAGSDGLLPTGQNVRGLELRGWVDQPEMDDLLARAAAAVIPQRSGFGALTRLPELACAGVPVITFTHPTYALNPPPGLRVVSEDWSEVCAAMADTLRHASCVDDEDYQHWEAEQPRPLAAALRGVLGG
jgi:glycosyltransferase involved in cell wall biosynthesis